MEHEDADDWGDISAEEFDYLERQALQKITKQSSNFVSRKVELPRVASSSNGQDDGSKFLPKILIKFFLHSTGNVAAKFQYEQVLVTAIKKVPFATWNAKERLWIFPLSSILSAEKILCDISGFIVEVENLDPLVRRAVSAACTVPDLRVHDALVEFVYKDRFSMLPFKIESNLLPFQRDGVRFVLQHGGRALLADEMGLGKTLQAIAVAACVRDFWPVLVLTPSSLRLHWASAIHQWLEIPSSDILVVLSLWSGSNRGGYNIVSLSSKGNISLDGLFNIISYDSVAKLQDLIVKSHFKVVIADESHYLKNAQAKRTTSSLPVIKKAKYAILLSGTPALSRPIELFKQIEALYPDVYKNVHEYGNRYCKGGIFGAYQGASNHEEFHHLMRATVMIRRLKKDVLSELPQKRRQQVFLSLSEKDTKQITALFRELEVVKGMIKGCISMENMESIKLKEKNLINKIYNESAEAKVPAVLDYLETIIEKKKVGCIRIDGGTPSALRQALVTDFQEKDNIKAAVLSIKAGGVGLTLTAASTVIFAELSWTPGDIIQAEDRAHRIGQLSAVNVYYLLANDTVDDIIWDVIQNKLENLGQMLDGREETLGVSEKHHHASPSKQKTLDSFMKRCSNANEIDDQAKTKFPRH